MAQSLFIFSFITKTLAAKNFNLIKSEKEKKKQILIQTGYIRVLNKSKTREILLIDSN